ncbi:hypothetical protein EJD96_09490 [Herbaspirillum seropedicae]|uniref:MFS transporter n=1 Tax=Herbaspirillum seropedicae TaxID=964 RepID=UPI00111D2827|nr:MFS transporter [Herbaspirillum seropedicae]QDD64379.1 hypothetical protein EJD96_09490 [Herbaspirillum seropedicae]
MKEEAFGLPLFISAWFSFLSFFPLLPSYDAIYRDRPGHPDLAKADCIVARSDDVIRLSLLLMCAAIGLVAQAERLGSAALLVSMAGLAEGVVMSLGLLRLYQTVDPSRLGRATALLDSASGAAFLLAVVVTGLLADTVAADRFIGGLALVLAILSLLLITSGLQGGDVGRAKENVLATKNHENQNDLID